MLRTARWVTLFLWLLSWFTIYLEIFHWHHMTTSLRLNPPPTPPGFPPATPGNFLIGSIALSIISPLAFITLLLVHVARLLRRNRGDTIIP